MAQRRIGDQSGDDRTGSASPVVSRISRLKGGTRPAARRWWRSRSYFFKSPRMVQQMHPEESSTTSASTFLDQQMVQPDLAELVDQHCRVGKAGSVVLRRRLEQGGLAATEEAGQQVDRHLGGSDVPAVMMSPTDTDTSRASIASIAPGRAGREPAQYPFRPAQRSAELIGQRRPAGPPWTA